MKESQCRTTKWATLILSCTLATCDSIFGGECVGCLDHVEIVYVTVVDDTGDPVLGVEFAVTRVEDGRDFTRTPEHHGGGSYNVIDNFFIDEVRTDGTRFRISGQKDGLGFEEELLIGTGRCRCHVRKLAGPDTVVLR